MESFASYFVERSFSMLFPKMLCLAFSLLCLPFGVNIVITDIYGFKSVILTRFVIDLSRSTTLQMLLSNLRSLSYGDDLEANILVKSLKRV